jgi:spore coat protein U-like protein
MNCRKFRNTVIVASLAALSVSAFAAGKCHFDSQTGVGFGDYSIFSTAPNNSGVGSLRINCNGGQKHSIVVTLSAGHSNGYAQREMTSGRNSLKYNIYTSAARSVVWGDGTGGSSKMIVDGDKSTILDVFGQIPAGQDAGVGSYTDNILVTVEF